MRRDVKTRTICLAVLLLNLMAIPTDAADRDLDEFLESLSLRLHEKIENSGRTRPGVVELGNPDESTGGKLGTLGKYVALRISDTLANISDKSYVLVDRVNLERILREQELQLSGIFGGPQLARIGSLLPCDSLIIGKIDQVGSLITVKVDLVDIEEGTILTSVFKRLPVTIDTKALLGLDYEDVDLIKEMALQTRTEFPYYLRVKVRNQYREEYFHQGRRYILAEAGVEYSIELENRTSRLVGVALLVDGINTVYMRRELPREAVKWVLEPKQKVTIAGWQTDASHARRFMFAAIEESLAAKRGFSQDVGLISAAFFPKQEDLSRSEQQAGTRAGAVFGSSVEEVSVRLERDPATILNIWYAYRYGLRERGIPIP